MTAPFCVKIRDNEKSPEPCGSRDFPGIPGGGDYWTRTSDLLRVKEFAENSLKPMRRSWLRVLIFRILQHFLQMVARIRRNLPDEATVYDTTAL